MEKTMLCFLVLVAFNGVGRILGQQYETMCVRLALGVCKQACLQGEATYSYNDFLCPSNLVGTQMICCRSVANPPTAAPPSMPPTSTPRPGAQTFPPSSTQGSRCGEWSDWSACSSLCGAGQVVRVREGCEDSEQELGGCDSGPCPAWGVWSPWTPCTKTCAGGTRQRRRQCLQGGKVTASTDCEGNAAESQGCNLQMCPDLSCGKSDYLPISARLFNAGTAERCSHPWFVTLKVISGADRTIFCSGVLIDKNSVLTTGFCARMMTMFTGPDFQRFVEMEMIVGEYNTNSTSGVTVKPNVTVFHDNYVHRNINDGRADPLFALYDYAVIQLQGELPLGSCLNYACLPDSRTLDYTKCKVVSFGDRGVNATGPSNLLQETNPQIGIDDFCYAALGFQPGYPGRNQFNKNFLCGSRPNSYKFCAGDEGGLLICPDSKTGQWTAAALSRSSEDQITDDCTAPREAMVYAKVDVVLGWIRDVMIRN